jgi:hypothetical protein
MTMTMMTMNKPIAVVIASVVVLVSAAACSSGPATAPDACYQVLSSGCQKLFACVDAPTIQQTLGYTSQDDCATKLQAQANCSATTCPAGTTFDSSLAQKCLDDINALACADAQTTPQSCKQTFCK